MGSINNTVILTPNLTWEQRVGFTRLRAYCHHQPGVQPERLRHQSARLENFPANRHLGNADPTLANELAVRSSPSFGNAGMFQNQWEYGTTLNWVKGRHTLAFGVLWDHTQLNIINHNTNTDTIAFRTFLDFVEGTVRTGIDSTPSPARPIATTGPIRPARL